MGVYMSSPVTEKISEDRQCEVFTFGASSMQGWRMSQEDAHNCIPDFDEETNTSLFAVYDGHGGSEVAKYCSAKLPDFIKCTEQYKEKNLADSLKKAFLGFDETLTHEDVIKELKVLAGDDDGDEDDEDTDDIAVRKEADILCEEASMPIEELRAKYSGNPLLQNKHLKGQKQPSPMIKAKRSKQMTGNGATVESIKENLDLKVDNEHPDNDNNLNTEKELKETSSLNENKQDNTNHNSDLTDNSEAAVSSSTSDSRVDINKDGELKDCSEVNADGVSTSSKDDKKSTESGEASSTSSVCSSSVSSSSGSSGTCSIAAGSVLPSGSGDAAVSGTAASSSVATSSSAGASSSDGVSAGSGQASSSSSGLESGPSGSGEPGSSGMGGSGKKSGMTLADLDSDDDDDDDTSDDEEEYDSEDFEDEEDDEEGDEEEEEGGPGLFNYVKQDFDQPDEEPGSDSGCTAVVALLRDKELVVANAGDSRCVLCRGGKAVDLSVDHKPEDKRERDRIEAAGGQVTADGRVNGGLNLSRAIGDHYYKRNETKDAADQMISADPDIESVSLCDEDEFFVLACDGIWNYMTSQEVIDYVRERLKDTKKLNKPSLICEEMFDYCLAPNTNGDGTGCDNMTCIIVVFNQTDNKKRELNTSGSSEPPEKRQRTNEEEEVK